MLKTERMCRISLVADKSILVRLVHVLQSLGCVQFAPFEDKDKQGLDKAAMHTFFPVESYLVALRSMKEYLGLTPPVNWEPIAESELLVTLPDQMEILTAAVKSVREKLEKQSAREREVDRQMRALAPFEDLDMDLALLSDYQSLRIFAVNTGIGVKVPPPQFIMYELSSLDATTRKKNRSTQITTRDALIAEAQKERMKTGLTLLAVSADNAEAMQKHLASCGLTPLKLPEDVGDGVPRVRLEALLKEKQMIAAEVQILEAERKELGQKWNMFIHAGEETLVSLLSKNNGTTNFLVTKYAMTARFWLREDDRAFVEQKLAKHFPKGLQVYTESDEDAEEDIEASHGHAEERDEPLAPTSMKTSWWTRPFVLLTEMFDVPRYGELDPTAMLAIFFPLFFGFMVGDTGYGAIMALGGWLMLRKFRTIAFSDVMCDLARILFVGGVISVLFGFFIFADMFGIPFHPEENSIFWWGKVFPLLPHPVMLKTEGASVNNMLMLSVMAGWLHMGIGCMFGIINEWAHSKKHALGRFGQLLVISGFTILIMGLDAFRPTPLGQTIWATVLLPVAYLPILPTLLVLWVGGMACVAIGEGPTGLLEFFGLFGNVISFTRLALVGVSKAAVAIAINTVLIPQLIDGGSIPVMLMLIVALIIGHLVMVLLGGLSASIQAVRLHYCETFMKFFKGGGIRFAPFGFKRTFTRS